jgi:hypothetical protein
LTSHHETPVEKLAEEVERDRANREEAVEADRVNREDVVEIARAEYARVLEEDRKHHNIYMEERLQERTRQVNRRFLVLFLGMALIFGLLAYRSELADNRADQNAYDIRKGLYEACQARADGAQKYNDGIDNLVQLSEATPRTPPLTDAQKVTLEAQIRQAFFRPIEDCGVDPASVG